ncbi:MAG TPA: hypothetical protein VIT41_12845 [Microlunatus sp.]
MVARFARVVLDPRTRAGPARQGLSTAAEERWTPVVMSEDVTQRQGQRQDLVDIVSEA